MNQQLLNEFSFYCEREWLIGYQAQKLYHLTIQKINQLQKVPNHKNKPLNILIVEKNYLNFIASFFASVITNNYIFLCNPDWQQSEWQQVFDLVTPDLIWSSEVTIKNIIDCFEEQKNLNSFFLVIIKMIEN